VPFVATSSCSEWTTSRSTTVTGMCVAEADRALGCRGAAVNGDR
jgi:hypothetical protein